MSGYEKQPFQLISQAYNLQYEALKALSFGSRQDVNSDPLFDYSILDLKQFNILCFHYLDAKLDNCRFYQAGK